MRKPERIVLVTQHYAPDPTTTATILSAIANDIARDTPILIMSGIAGSATHDPADAAKPRVVEIKNWMPRKNALVRRALAELLFSLRTFFALLGQLNAGDIVLTVTSPFLLPYAVVLAAKLKRSRSILIMHDLYPDVLVMSGLLSPRSVVTKSIHFANALMYRGVDAVVTIGRDVSTLLMRYKGLTPDKLVFIPNWATLRVGARPITASNVFRDQSDGRFVIGLSGNLGYTHDPVVVFEAARLLRDDPTIQFLLSGWGIGFQKLRALQDEARLPNVKLIDRVPEENLEDLLSAADIWIIPYRKNVAGVSVPSRFYNLLAVGRPVLIISEPDAEAALTVVENDIGWVTRPGDAVQLAETLRQATTSDDLAHKRERAAHIATQFSFETAMQAYKALIRGLDKTAGTL